MEMLYRLYSLDTSQTQWEQQCPLQDRSARMPPDDEEIADLTLDSAEALKLPNMNEFSPGVLEGVTIRPLLAQLAPLQGDDRDAMIGHLGRAFRRLADTADAGQRDKRSNNVLIGMSQCGLLDKEGDRILPRLSDLANRLLGVPTDADAADAFAAHLIENCHGRDLIDAVRTIRARAEPVQLSTIRAELRSRGFIVTENEGNASKIRQWLQHAGISDEYWNINDARLAATIGATSSTLAKWNGLDRAQRAFLTQLREFTRRGPVDWTEVREIKRLCETGHGRDIFPEGRLRAEVIDPLAVDCWLQTRGTGRGRGGDSGQVLALRQLTDLRISLPLDAVGAIPADLLDRLGTPLPDIFRDL
ncbi:MAG: hypothetical protein FJ143_04085, partial [Deltaproteobacteria bacterium]|nr:hypothetical protein [Deltaproteobacteria bacterium]